MSKKNILDQLEKIEDFIQTQDCSPELLKDLKQQLSRIVKQVQSEDDSPINILCDTVGTETDQVQSSTEIIQIWSDGSCFGNPGPGGWGTIIKTQDQYLEFSGYSPDSTNNIMEMTGALEGIIRTKEGAEIELTSDSQYLIKGMKAWIHGWKKRNWKKADGMPVLNQEIWKALDKETQKRTITWIWTKGHADNPMNERCDELAKDVIKKSRS